MKLDPYLTINKKNQLFNMDKRNKFKTWVYEAYVGGTLQDIGLGVDILDKIPKHRQQK